MKRMDSRLISIDPAVRCYLFYGADEAGSRALAAELFTRLGPDIERIDLTPAQLRGDPALLADEAASVSLFGGSRYIRVDGVGDECCAAVEALLNASTAGNPVLLLAGALRKDSRLLKRLGGDPLAMTIVSHPPDAADLARIAIALAAGLGLRIDEDLGRRLAESTGGDRAIMAAEIAKLADFADAAPDAPRVATHAMLDTIGADLRETDFGTVVDALTAGDPRGLEHHLGHLAGEGQDAVALLRAATRRMGAMAAVRAEMDRGMATRAAADRGARSLFWRDRETVVRDVAHWPATRLAMAIDRLSQIERQVKSTHGPGAVSLDRLLHAMARGVRR